MAITLSHGGPTIYRSPAPSRQVLVGTIEGVVCMERDSGGPGWHVAHRALTDKHIHALLIEPESGTIFAGANHGSIFASADGGQHLGAAGRGAHASTTSTVSRAPGWPAACASSPGRSPRTSSAAMISGAAGPSSSALRSVDMSRWGFPAPPHIAHTKHIDFHPEDPDTLFIGVEQGGLLKSTDAGRTFQVIPGMDDDVHRTVINPLNPDQMYITTGIGMYVTGDGGKTWEQRTDLQHEIGGYPDLLVLHPRQPELLFVASAEKGPGAWYHEPLRGLPHLQEHGRRADLGDLCAADCPTACGRPSRRCVWRTGGHRSRSSPRRRRARCGAATTAASSGRKS